MKNILLILLFSLSIVATAQTKKVVVIGTRSVVNYDSLKRLFVDTSARRNGYLLAFDSINHKWYLAAAGGVGGTTYTGTAPVAVTGSVITVDTTKAQGKIATFNDITINKFNAIAGTNTTITGTYPNLTFNSVGSSVKFTTLDGSGIVFKGTGKGSYPSSPTDTTAGVQIGLVYNAAGNRQIFLGNTEGIGIRINASAIDGWNNTTNTIRPLTINTNAIILGNLNVSTTPQFADNASALVGGLVVGDIYRTIDLLKIVH